jgi:hypothetical protein
MPVPAAPGVSFEIRERIAGPEPLRTDITGFVGMAARGPVDTPLAVQSWRDFETRFGGLIPNAYLGYAVRAFFENGGRRCHVVRVAAPAADTRTAPGVVQPPDGSASLVASVAGFAPGAVVTVRQAPDREAAHVLAEVDPGTRRLVWNRPLDGRYTLTAPLTFATGAACATAALSDGAGLPTLRVSAPDPGAWGNDLAVRVGRGVGAATATRVASGPADPAQAQLVDGTGFATGALVRVSQARGAVPVVAHRTVAAADAARAVVRWDQPLPPAFDLRRPLTVEWLVFSLTLLERGRTVATWGSLSLVTDHPRYVERVLGPGGDGRLVAEDLGSPAPPEMRLPDAAAPSMRAGTAALRGGRDGIAAVRPEHLTGAADPATRRGLRCLETVDEVAVVAIPDASIQPQRAVEVAPLPEPEPDPCLPVPAAAAPRARRPVATEGTPAFGDAGALEVQAALVAHCAAQRDRIALLDPPALADPRRRSLAALRSWRRRWDSSFAALYAPWLLVADPLRTGGEPLRALPPSGHVAGVIAQSDLGRGVHVAPANIPLRWAHRPAYELTAGHQELLNPEGINCVRVLAGRGLRVYGARTLSSDAQWRPLNVRRLLLMIEEALDVALQWTVFESNAAVLRERIVLSVSAFLAELWAAGALVGASAGEAFYVRCDDALNPPAEAAAGRLWAEVGVAPVTPAEFIVVRVAAAADGLEAAA